MQLNTNATVHTSERGRVELTDVLGASKGVSGGIASMDEESEHRKMVANAKAAMLAAAEAKKNGHAHGHGHSEAAEHGHSDKPPALEHEHGHHEHGHGHGEHLFHAHGGAAHMH